MKTVGTECSKCLAAMPAPAQAFGNAIYHAKFAVTGYRCTECSHWNDLKRRGKRNIRIEKEKP